MEQNTWRWRSLAIGLILTAACLHLVYLAVNCPLDLAPDEAHYWHWSRHLDWSYYSKGPLVAYLIRAGCELAGTWSLQLTGTEMLAVRLPAVLCGSLLLVALYVLTVQVFGRERLAFAVVALALTLPLISAGSTLMTIDAPYTCLWAWALVTGHRAIFRGAAWAWPVTGLLVGLGILAKYTMVFWLVSLGLFLITDRERRRLLWRPGFWVMSGTAAFCCLPILIWNYQHNWMTLKHNMGHAGEGKPFQWLGPLNFIAVQFALLLGFWFVAWMAALVEYRPRKERDPGIQYLWWMSAPTFVIFLLFGFKTGGGEPNWPVTMYLSGLVLTAFWLGRRLEAPVTDTGDASATPRATRRRVAFIGMAGASALGLALIGLLHFSGAIRPLLARVAGPASVERPFPQRTLDPTCRLRGWRHLAAEVDRLRAELRQQGIEPVLAGYNWWIPGQVAFYCQDHPEVYSIGPAFKDRWSQYDLWRPNPIADPTLFLGRTFLIVGIPCDALLAGFADAHTTHVVTHEEAGQPIAQWFIIVGKGFKGFNIPADRKH